MYRTPADSTSLGSLVTELDDAAPGDATPARDALRAVLAEVFNSHDYNKDGRMDVQEFRAAMRDMGDELSSKVSSCPEMACHDAPAVHLNLPSGNLSLHCSSTQSSTALDAVHSIARHPARPLHSRHSTHYVIMMTAADRQHHLQRHGCARLAHLQRVRADCGGMFPASFKCAVYSSDIARPHSMTCL